MNLLAIETATEACSVALMIDSALIERHEIAPRRHAELLLPWIDALLAEAGISKTQLDAIAVGRGPGAFTGVRLAIAAAQGIALALDRPVLPVSSLAALAIEAQANSGDAVLAAIDARMGEVYLGSFVIDQSRLPSAIDDERLCSPARPFIPTRESWIGVGTGFAAENDALQSALAGRLTHVMAAALPRASAIARLAGPAYRRGEAIPADALQPAYLRDKVAQTLIERGKPGPG